MYKRQDASKPVSTAQQTALNGKADDSQVLTNVPTGALFTDTIYTHPTTHPPAIIVQDANNRFSTDTEKSTWNAKAPLDSPALAGVPTAPTPATADNTTKLATTAFIKAQDYITSADSGAKIAVAAVAPTTPGPGDFWYKVI